MISFGKQLNADDVYYCIVSQDELDIFSQYLVFDKRKKKTYNVEKTVILGAVWNGFACAASELRLPDLSNDDYSAELKCLYVDPKIRRKGIGSKLLEMAIEIAGTEGAIWLDASYVAESEDAKILYHMFMKLGSEPSIEYSTYSVDIKVLLENRLLGEALTDAYQLPEQIVTFTKLSQEQLKTLEDEPELPINLKPSNRKSMESELSVAWVDASGKVVGFILGCMTAPGNYANLASWCSRQSPFNCFNFLLKAQLHRCFKQENGYYTYHICSTGKHTDKIIEHYSDGKFKRNPLYCTNILLSE